jgi:hypothetical protein
VPSNADAWKSKCSGTWRHVVEQGDDKGLPPLQLAGCWLVVQLGLLVEVAVRVLEPGDHLP